MKGRENPVWVTGGGSKGEHILGRKEPRQHVGLDAQSLQCLAYGLVSTHREGADVFSPEHRLRAEIVDQLRHDFLRPTLPHHEPAPALSQRVVEVVKALEQKLGSGPGAVAAAKEPGVEAEQRDDPFVGGQRSAQGGVVIDAEIAPEPQHRRHRSSSAMACAL
jgi:hypothetical protein